MPTNRHAAIRYRVIDHCLQQRSYTWTATALAEACAEALGELGEPVDLPSRSTISRDIRLMRRPHPLGYDAPIVWDARRNTYYYSDPAYSISNGPLREDDLQALDGALSILRQFRHFSQVGDIELLATRLQQSLKASRRQESSILQFSQPGASPAYKWLDFLYRSTEQEHCLKLHYEPFQEEAFEAVISPYLIKEYNGRWFLIAYNHNLRRLRTIAIDRIQQVERYLLEPFYRAPHFHPDTYFKHIIGVSLLEDHTLEEILFRTTPLRARYLLTKPVHASLKEVGKGPGFVDFSLQLIPNYELESWFLSFGEEVLILQPHWLAEKMKGRLQKAVVWYEGSES